MTDYSHIVPESLILERDPVASDCAQRSVDVAVLRINEDHTVEIATRTLYGGDATPMAEYHGRDLVYRIARGPCALDVDRLRADLADGGWLSVLVDRLIAGHTVEWNGNNMVGRIADNGAEEEIAHDLYNDSYASDAEVWGASEWLYGGDSTQGVMASLAADHGLTIDSSPEEVAKAAATLEMIASRDGVTLVGSLEDVILEVIAEIRKEREEEDA